LSTLRLRIQLHSHQSPQKRTGEGYFQGLRWRTPFCHRFTPIPEAVRDT
jgi:hypothetical protein